MVKPMAYTVKKISSLSGVTVRALHYYEEIGLLKPAYYGANGYRYFEKKELLQLQQIMFFKELGFTLKQIQKIVGKSDFDQISALYSHKKALSQEKEKIGLLIKTIDKTIKHLTRNKKMKDEEFFSGFSEIKFNPNSPTAAEEALILKNLKKSDQKKDKAFHEKINKKIGMIYKKISLCIDKGLKPAAKEVQLLIKEHHAIVSEFHKVDKKIYKALSELYLKHPEFKKQLDFFHPRLAEFMKAAMEIFADLELI